MALVLIVLLFVFTSIDPPKVIFSGFALYALSGPIWWVWRRLRRLGRRSAPRTASTAEGSESESGAGSDEENESHR